MPLPKPNISKHIYVLWTITCWLLDVLLHTKHSFINTLLHMTRIVTFFELNKSQLGK